MAICLIMLLVFGSNFKFEPCASWQFHLHHESETPVRLDGFHSPKIDYIANPDLLRISPAATQGEVR